MAEEEASRKPPELDTKEGILRAGLLHKSSQSQAKQRNEIIPASQSPNTCQAGPQACALTGPAAGILLTGRRCWVGSASQISFLKKFF